MRFLNFLLLLCFSFNITPSIAQVVIGSSLKPVEGAILQLKENDNLEANSNKGLLLPRVQLTTVESLDDIGTNLDKDAHTGLMVYSPKSFGNYCSGTYVWSGQKWKGPLGRESNPDFITVQDVDGNTYYAKAFLKKGCTAVYWMTSNMRSTRDKYGNPFERPLYYNASKAYLAEENFNENDTEFGQVRTKSDISTIRTVTYYKNNEEIVMSEDDFVSKFGLGYTYKMAIEDSLVCPIGWSVPIISDWGNLLESIAEPGSGNIYQRGAPYVKADNSLYLPSDKDIFAAEDPIEALGEPYSRLYAPKHMNGFPSSDPRNSGLNIYPSGTVYIREPSSGIPSTSVGFGTYGHILEQYYFALKFKDNLVKIEYTLEDETKPQLLYGNVRCIKKVVAE